MGSRACMGRLGKVGNLMGALQREGLRRERPTIPRSQAQVETAERGVNRAATVLEFPVSRRSMPFSGGTHRLGHTLSHFRHKPGVILL